MNYLLQSRMDNNIYAIHSILQKMSDTKRNKFFSLSNLIIDLQQKHSTTVIDVSDEQVVELQNYTGISKDKYRELSDSYGTYALFNEIKSCTGKSSPIKKVRSVFEGEQAFIEELKVMLNVVALVNLLQKRLKNKTIQELVDYNLVNKLAQINPELPNYLNVSKLTSFTTDSQLEDFVKDEYVTYDEIQFDEIYAIYDDKYPTIHELINLFQ
jgi:hypothetical protein